jgi:NTE family protein
MTSDSVRRGLALGCGGTLGFAWSVVALDFVEQALGWDAREATAITGTSAGSELAAMLGSGISTADIRAALEGTGGDHRVAAHLAYHPGMFPPVPALRLPRLGLAAGMLTGRVQPLVGGSALLPRGRGDASFLRALGEVLQNDEGWVDHPATWVITADVRTGERVALGHNTPAQLGDAIAASWGIPGWFPPVRIGDRDLMDGGTFSTASADLLLDADVDEVVIIAPMTSHGGAAGQGWARAERVLRAAMTKRLDAEVELLTKAGVRVIRIEPTLAELDAMGANFMDLSRREATIAAAAAALPTTINTILEGAQA